MVNKWPEVVVGDVADTRKNALVGGPFGSNLVSKDYVGIGVPVIRGQNMGSRFVGGDFVFVTEEKAQALIANTARPGDLVFTQRGTLGQVALVPDGPYDTYIVSQSQMKMTPDLEKADPHFLYYVFSSPEQLAYIDAHAIKVGVPHTNLGILRNTPLVLPPLVEQRRIAHILGTLDDKIELNRQLNTTLEQLARALFQSWFVDFDPVRAKASGEPADSICRRLGLTPELLALFPAELEASALGEVPVGWEVQSLDKAATFLNGLACQKFPPQGKIDLPVIKIAQLRKGDTTGADLADASSVPTAYIVENGDVLFSWSGSLEVEIWGGGIGMLNQHLFKVDSDLYPKWFYYLWTRHHLPAFRLIASDKATTMGHIQRKHLTNAKVLVPSSSLIESMTAHFAPLLDQLEATTEESRTLAALRDELLPKLLSGDIRLN